jgi:hypothetical protein
LSWAADTVSFHFISYHGMGWSMIDLFCSFLSLTFTCSVFCLFVCSCTGILEKVFTENVWTKETS